MKHCENYQNVTKIQEERRCCWINDTDRLARCRVGINLWFVKHSVCTKCNKAKSHQVRWIIVLTTQISLLNPHQITVEKVPIFMLLMRMLRQRALGPSHSWNLNPGRWTLECVLLTHSLWHKSSWKRLPLAPPQSCQAGDPQTGEQLYQRRSCTVLKVLGTTTNFPTWGSSKETENPQGIWHWRSVGS